MKHEMEDPLPPPRVILTSLINKLTSQPLPPPRTQAQPRTTRTNPQHAPNPLSLLPAHSRTLLTTLHVLYPSLLLPALDLLDRHLVTRVLVLDDIAARPPPSSSCSSSSSPSALRDEAEQARLDARSSVFHLVRSAQQQSRRGRRSGGGSGGGGDGAGGLTYVVRTTSWSCDCAAFAFGAFPAEASSFPPSSSTASDYYSYHINSSDHHYAYSSDSGSGHGVGDRWEFGGLSFDGRDRSAGGPGGSVGHAGGASVPCCKHLLACVLAERWSVLGGYVQERRVGREEAAGLIGAI
ncbi:hypothetical protein BJ170DRAFT_62612 [Xylariales sp. AK1849]|nr:hypothetical protein BJ170DRAFT_62612 [Xylariales sp. AK1849]